MKYSVGPSSRLRRDGGHPLAAFMSESDPEFKAADVQLLSPTSEVEKELVDLTGIEPVTS